MAANLPSLVNQQLYHAKLLLNMVGEQDKQALHYRAGVQALLNGAVQAVYLAYQGFLSEVAISCQIKEPCLSLQALNAALESEGRSHAIVSNLNALLALGSSFVQEANWLQHLLNAHAKVFQVAPAKPNRNSQLIIQALGNDLDPQGLADILQNLTHFIDSQRDYLQEW